MLEGARYELLRVSVDRFHLFKVLLVEYFEAEHSPRVDGHISELGGESVELA